MYTALNMIVEYVKNIKNEKNIFFTSFQLNIIKSYNLLFFGVKERLTKNDSFIYLVEVIRQFMQ